MNRVAIIHLLAEGRRESRQAKDEMPASPETHGSEAWIVYDGQCPFCSRYVQLLRLRASLGHVRLIDARDSGPIGDELQRAGVDLNEGMVLKLDDRIYQGRDCIHVLALLSTPSGAFNRINAALFRSPRAARLLYPVLRAGRNGVLRLLGRSKIRQQAA